MKRFYKIVSIADQADGFAIHLDGRPVKTPSGQTLIAPLKPMANAIMAEWSAQGDDIIPDTMPLTQYLTTARDKVSQERTEMTAQIMRYLHTDLLCYRTDEPEILASLQAQNWDPVLSWFAGKVAVTLETTTGLQALKQPDEAHDKIVQYCESLDDMQFTILQALVPLGGSIVLALAFLEGEVAPEAFEKACYVEEDYKADLYNEEKYGAAPNQEKARAALQRDVSAARTFLDFFLQ